MKFSVITVALNAGDKLIATIENILEQNFSDYEIIIKDGFSTDGSIEKIKYHYLKDSRICLMQKKDQSIYDAMNQAIKVAKGDYFIFMNCGDFFADNQVLEKTAARIDKNISEKEKYPIDIYYGNQYLQKQKCEVPYPKEITDFVCYRNVPCHQVCFYNRRLFEKRGYDLKYPVRADYEHFLWCKYKSYATFEYMNFCVSSYEGDGFSETKENMEQAVKEHKEITKKYLGFKCIIYRMIMIITLQPLRKKLADSEKFAGVYQKIKGKIV